MSTVTIWQILGSLLTVGNGPSIQVTSSNGRQNQVGNDFVPSNRSYQFRVAPHCIWNGLLFFLFLSLLLSSVGNTRYNNTIT